MATPEYRITCTRNERIAHDVYEFVMTKPEGFTFVPGQFVLIDFPLVDDVSDIQPRAFSLSSTPVEPSLLFAAKLIDGGRASRWIAEKLSEGDELRIVGPFGNFVLNEDTEKPFLFVCTSTGICPFRSQIISALEAGDTREMHLVFGARSEEDLFWVNELSALTEKFPNFTLHTSLTKPSDSWTGHTGRVQTVMSEIAPTLTDWSIYICGNPDMTSELKTLCRDAGVEKVDLHVEGYI